MLSCIGSEDQFDLWKRASHIDARTDLRKHKAQYRFCRGAQKENWQVVIRQWSGV